MNILFIHGAWMTPLCWEKFAGFFDSKGVRWQAPAWPYKDAPIETLRAHPDPNLAGLGITEIVDHYDRIIRGLPEPPVLIGHSFGGLFTQMLLDRGLGAAGIAIDSAPPKGVNPFRPTVFRANLRILATPGGWHKIIQPSFADFQYGFANNMPQPEQRAAFDRYVVPESGRPFFQSAFAMFNNITRVNFANNRRAPLLLIAGSVDHLCPAAMIRDNYAKYRQSTVRTDFKEFENRAHWIIGQPGWEEVADYCLEWIQRL